MTCSVHRRYLLANVPEGIAGGGQPSHLNGTWSRVKVALGWNTLSRRIGITLMCLAVALTRHRTLTTLSRESPTSLLIVLMRPGGSQHEERTTNYIPDIRLRAGLRPSAWGMIVDALSFRWNCRTSPLPSG
jgi:hypothetical protein